MAQVIGSAQGGVMSCVMNYYRHIDRTKVQFDFFTYEAGPYDEEIASLGEESFTFPTFSNRAQSKHWKSISDKTTTTLCMLT